MSYVNITNSKSRTSREYADRLEQIKKDAVCPFCPDHLKKYHKHPIEEKSFWWVTDNMYPYKPTKHHRLIIHKSHIEHVKEISPEAWLEVQEIIKAETERLNIKGGTLVLRFGDTSFTGGSVSHLHMHITQSNPDSEDYDTKKGLIMRIG